MEYVAGKDFFKIVRERGRLPEKEAVKYIRQIASALAVIHKEGLVHRDAHPGNIILQGDKAILIDFGIAKELVPTTLSSTGDAGNSAFAPYEQMMKGSREKNADVYCLAATLYYLVTGQRPVGSLDRKLYNTALIAPRKLVLEVSKDLNRAIIKGMELEAENRPQSVEKWSQLFEVQKQRKKVIPLLELGFLLTVYICTGAFFLLASVPYFLWILSVAVVGVVVGTYVRIWADLTLAEAGTVAGIMSVAGFIAVAVAETVAEAGAVAFFWVTAGAVASKELFQYFTRFHVFLILAITSLLGLGLGGLLGFAYKGIFNS